MVEKSLIMDSDAVNRALTRISHEILEKNKGIDNLVIIGIKNRGIPIANVIAKKIRDIENQDIPIGTIDVRMYRDDIEGKSGKPIISGNEINFELKDKIVVLVDDVLYTGRTVRSALDAIVDIARPKSVQLAVLVDRGHRELPIRADFVGKNVPTSLDEIVKVDYNDTTKRISASIFGM